MVNLYNENTNELICSIPRSIAGLTFNNLDIIVVDGERYRIRRVEHVLEKSGFSNVDPKYIERKLFAVPEH